MSFEDRFTEYLDSAFGPHPTPDCMNSGDAASPTRRAGAQPPQAAQAAPVRKRALSTLLYGTLDEIDDGMLTSLPQVWALTVGKFSTYHGAVLGGPASLEWHHSPGYAQGYWGKAIALPSRELLQVRYYPSNITEYDASEYADTPDIVYFATRVSHTNGSATVQSCILVRPGFLPEAEDGFHDLARLSNPSLPGIGSSGYGGITTDPRVARFTDAQLCRLVACRGVPIIPLSFYRQHDPRAGAGLPTARQWSHDGCGHAVVPITTYSLFETDRKHLEQSKEHHRAIAATAGMAAMSVAAEIVDLHDLPYETTGRHAEPISRKKWRMLATGLRREVCTGGETEGRHALESAAAILELLSPEGFIGMRANRFFDGALPDRFAGPHGPALALALGARLAMHWDKYGLPKPSLADQHANDVLRMILATCSEGPLPTVDKMWAIDVVLQVAIRRAQADIEKKKRQQGIHASHNVHLEHDNKVLLQRMVQRVITALFGLGAAVPHLAAEKTEFEKAWRLRDATQEARDAALIGEGCAYEGIEPPVLQLAPLAKRKDALCKALLGVERWLRTGLVGKHQLSQANVPEEHEQHVRRLKDVFGDLLLPSMVWQAAHAAQGKPLPTGSSFANMLCDEDEVIERVLLHGTLNVAALTGALTDAAALLTRGPTLWFGYKCGAHLVAPSQTTRCSECEQPVSVLQGVLFQHSYSECSACHRKRCLSCAFEFGRTVGKLGPGITTVGHRCRACGAEPGDVHMFPRAEGSSTTGRRSYEAVLTKRVSAERLVLEKKRDLAHKQIAEHVGGAVADTLATMAGRELERREARRTNNKKKK